MGDESKIISKDNPAVLTVFDGVRDNDADNAEVVEAKTFAELRDYLEQSRLVGEDKDAAPFIVPGPCDGGRKKADIGWPRAVALDVDKSPVSPEVAIETLDLLEVDYVLHTTHSNGTEEGLYSYRIWLNVMVGSVAEMEAFAREAFDLLRIEPTKETWNTTGFFGPSVHPERLDAYQFESCVDGHPLAWQWEPNEVAKSTWPAKSSDWEEPPADWDTVKEQLDCIPNHERDTWFVVGMALHSTGEQEAFEAFCDWSESQDYPDYSEEACAELWRRADADREGGATLLKIEFLAREYGWHPDPGRAFADLDGNGAEGTEVPVVELTDAHFSARLVADHRHHLRFVENLETFVRFDGRRWVMDRKLAAMELAKESGRAIAAEIARETGNRPGPEVTWARRCNSAGGIKAAIELAKPPLNIPASFLDADTMLVNVQNGTIDLRTHELRPHDPVDLITKIAPASYRPDARCERWDRFLEDVLPDEEMRRFFQAVMGYSLQGGQEAKAFFVVYGPGDTGKSTALRACTRALGTSIRSNQASGDDDSAPVTRFYAESTDMATFTVKKYGGGGNKPEMAKLMGARIVVVNETKSELLESRDVKSWTGGDQMQATPKYGHPLTFYADGTLFFVGNERPDMEFDDDAMWNRTMALPFTEAVPEEKRIPGLDDLFDLDAVLAWMVEGHRIYAEEGLRPPEVARLARDAYRDEVDPLADFVAAQVRIAEVHPTTGEPAWASRTELYKVYSEWVERVAGLRPFEKLKQTAVTRNINSRAERSGEFRVTRRSAGWGWEGLYVLGIREDDQDEDIMG